MQIYGKIINMGRGGGAAGPPPLEIFFRKSKTILTIIVSNEI